MKLLVNGKEHEVAAPDDMPLLWVLRDVLGMTGTKFGCGMAQCGACTVLLDGEPIRSCVRPAAELAGRSITHDRRIGDGRRPPGAEKRGPRWTCPVRLLPSGQIMTTVALLKAKPTHPTPTSTRPGGNSAVRDLQTHPQRRSTRRRNGEA